MMRKSRNGFNLQPEFNGSCTRHLDGSPYAAWCKSIVATPNVQAQRQKTLEQTLSVCKWQAMLATADRPHDASGWGHSVGHSAPGDGAFKPAAYTELDTSEHTQEWCKSGAKVT